MCVVVVLPVLAGTGLCARTEADASAVADGIAATLRVDADGATVGWRFQHRPPAPIHGVAVTLNGRALGVPPGPFAPFPAPGQSAALLCLTEQRGADAADIAAQLAGLAPAGRIALRSVRFGEGRSAAGEARDMWPVGLAEAISRGVADLAGATADRRILIVVTDGFARDALPFDALAQQAAARDVSVVFALAPGPRLADVAALARLAERTGGVAVPAGGDLPAALLRSVLSGAAVRFPYGEARRYIWERHAIVRARLDYGDRSLDVMIEADLPPAGPSATLALFWGRAQRRLPAFAGGVAVTLMGVLAYRRWPHAPV